MDKKVIVIEILLYILLIVSNESRADIVSEMRSPQIMGQCGIAVKKDPDYKNCVAKVPLKYLNVSDMKKHSCCKPLDYYICTTDSAKRICSQTETNNIKRFLTYMISKVGKLCSDYHRDQSLCGTNAHLLYYSSSQSFSPSVTTVILSLIIASILVVMEFD